MADYLIIVAGGKGLRMGSDVPKQFMLLGGKPVLMRTIERFLEALPSLHIVLVLPEVHVDYWRSLCEQYDFRAPLTIALGGKERFHSVKNGLAQIDALCSCTEHSSRVCAVHDAVRPLVSVEVIRRAFSEAAQCGAVVPALSAVDSVRVKDGEGHFVAVDRRDVMLVQTPQVFQYSVLAEAYAQPYRDVFTDDASVVESLGHPIRLIEGNRENIKITTPIDILLAQLYLSEK
ncbi:MAG: 2-C-methyl-D-erythritol 4-phosphate cytidylyltransferase [Prevotellaceae bacterium]|nr:2-C-methyl-D-erythritol 4-phosphate cytidylyltransferase [Prevotellaceae bacterium]